MFLLIINLENSFCLINTNVDISQFFVLKNKLIYLTDAYSEITVSDVGCTAETTCINLCDNYKYV